MAIILGIHDDQLFLGYGKYEAFKIKIKKLTIYFGLFIPLPWLAKFYSYKDGVKARITYEWEFYKRSIGLRLLVTFGGTLGSLLTSMFIFSILSYMEQDQYISKDALNEVGIYPSEYAESYGFQKGDKILKVNGEDYTRFQDLLPPLAILDDLSQYEILRGKDTVVLRPDWDIDEFSENTFFIFVPNSPHKIIGLSYGMAAEKSGMKEGDIITMIDTIQVSSLQEISNVLDMHAGDTVSIQVKRGEDFHWVTPVVSKDGRIGFYASTTIEYSFYQKSIGEAIADGAFSPFDIIKINLKGFAQLFGAEITTNRKVNGPVRIANLFGDPNTAQFFRISAILLALIPIWDLFPFPKSAALKSIPLVSEFLIKKRMSYDFFVKIRKMGWFIIGVLMVGTLINDMTRLI